MLLTKETKHILMRRFPKLELSYCKIINRKVSADYFMVVPKGPKSILWFTYIDNKNVCILATLNYQGKIQSFELHRLSFSDELSYGTALYGTVVMKNKRKHFVCENIHYYKGKNVERCSYYNKLTHINELFTDNIINNIPKISTIVVWCSVIDHDLDNIKLSIQSLPYTVYGIKYLRKNKNYALGVEKNTVEINLEANFNVKAMIRDDIYGLYCNNEIYYASAFISSYKRSVFMNEIFRNIKENKNLDFLEESDDEEEFENIEEDKFVNINKIVKMKCVYNRRFKKWEPCEIINSTDDTIITIEKVKELENKVL